MNTLQPSSRYCFICGVSNPLGLHLKFYNTAPGEVTAECTLGQEYQGYPGVAHGGIVAAMLDEAAGRSHMSGEPPRFMFTAKLEVRYRKNVPLGEPLRLVGKATSSRPRVAQAIGAIYNQQGDLLAEAEALLVDVPEEALRSLDSQELGWQVYPE